MAFTYSDDLSTTRDQVRFYIQDTVEDSGPKPSDGNFSDDEITNLITLEGSWQRAVAAAFETLAAAWMRYPNFSADGLRLDRGAIAKGYREQAAKWRARFGESSTGTGSVAVTRVDGYSDDVDNMET